MVNIKVDKNVEEIEMKGNRIEVIAEVFTGLTTALARLIIQAPPELQENVSDLINYLLGEVPKDIKKIV